MAFFILNQYAYGVLYKDKIGERYHFPKKYHSRSPKESTPFIYYEPKTGGRQIYFGTGILEPAVPDIDQTDHYYSRISYYEEFPMPVPFHSGPSGLSWEEPSKLQNSIRSVDANLFNGILAAGGIKANLADISDQQTLLYLEDLIQDLQESKSVNIGRIPQLKRVRRVYEAYERPSSITNSVKSLRGHRCQLCGALGFLMKNGSYYCEVHHVYHLSKNPPQECLLPNYLIVLCANCHRRVHYADVGEPVLIKNGWIIQIDGIDYNFETKCK